MKPGHRYFILNGEPLFHTYPNLNDPQNIPTKKYNPEHTSTKLQQQPQFLQKPETDYSSIPFESVLFNNQLPIAESNLESNFPILNSGNSKYFPSEQIQPKNQQNQVDLRTYAPQNPSIIPLEVPQFHPQQAFFKSRSSPKEQGSFYPIGQFRYTPPNEPYFPFGGEDVENDAIVVVADDKTAGESDNKENQESENEGNIISILK